MLDDATKRALEAYAERMATKSSRSANPHSRKILHQSPSFQQYKELSSKLNSINTIYSTFSSSEPQNRKKRRRTCEEPSFQQLVNNANQINVGLTDKYPLPNKQIEFFSWPQNFTFSSIGANESFRGFESKNSSCSAMNHGPLPRKSASGSHKNSSNAGLLTFDRDTVGSQNKDVEIASNDFSKEIEDAISRIESLIPSLQELVNSVHTPAEKSVGKSDRMKQEKVELIRANELGLTDNSGALGENMVGKKVSQKTIECNLPTPTQVEWSKGVRCVNDDSKSNTTQKMVDEPLNQISVQNDGRMRNLDSETISNAIVSQVSRPKAKAIMSIPESPKQTPSRTESSASQHPESIQGSRIMPRQTYHVGTKDAILRPCEEVASVGSTSFKDHESRRIALEKDLSARESLNKYDEIRKVVPHDQSSEETSKSSSVSSSATTQESGSPSSSGTYHSYGSDDSYDSVESEPQHEKVSWSTRGKQPELSECNSGYDDDNSSSDSSQEEYSDAAVPSSPISSVRAPKWRLQKQRGEKAKGRIKRFGKKIGMIFHHHHHHHHHHYGDKDEPDVQKARSIWKRFGKMFHHTRETDNPQKPKIEKTKKSEDEKPRASKVENSRKSEIKTLVKKQDKKRHFQAFVGGLMKHVKPSKKTKQIKNGIKKLGVGRSVGKREGKKLPWWPKFHGNKGKVKVPKKGKVKFQNFYRTQSLAAAKMILGKKK